MKDIITNKQFDIISNLNNISDVAFRTIDDKAMVEICEWLPEVSRGVSCFSKQNSQTTTSLMSLNMLDSGPYRILRQILAQSEKKRTALKEAIYKIELKKVKYQQLLIEMDNTLNNDLEYRTLDLKSRKILSDIVDSQPVIEASMKELGALKRRYEEVIKNNNIPVNWDEQDFEDAEIEHHIRSIFRNGIRDRMQGSHNMGTMEYMEQFGINPITAYAFIDKYIHDIRDCISDGRGADITSHYIFYDKMYEVFKDEYKKASARIGLDNITQADFLMKEIK